MGLKIKDMMKDKTELQGIEITVGFNNFIIPMVKKNTGQESPQKEVSQEFELAHS